MAGIGKFKLTDAIAQPAGKGQAGQSRQASPAQLREEDESRKAKKAGTSNRSRMVEIGRGSQQAGRQGSS